MPQVRSQKSEVRIKLIFLLISIVVIAITAWAGEASAMLTARANHDHITVDFFYHGSTVSVRGISEPGTDLVIKMTSPEGHQVLKKKAGLPAPSG